MKRKSEPPPIASGTSHWPLPAPVFKALAAAHQRVWGVRMYAVLPDGELALGKPPCGKRDCDDCRKARQLAVGEALRWGEPSVEFCPNRHLVWAVPVMRNQELLGGIVCEAGEDMVFPDDPARTPLDVRGACAALLRLAEEHNLTNAALLESRRLRHGEERLRAEAIHAYKSRGAPDLRAACRMEEESLLDAVRRNDKGAARAALNRMVVAIHFQAGRRLEVLKSYCLELAVILSRTAAETDRNGAAPLDEQLGHTAELAALATEEDLLAWLSALLNRVMERMLPPRPRDTRAAYLRALEHMRRHFSGPLSREETARAAGVSPAHFSRLFKKHAGCGYSEMLTRMRVDKARQLLAHTDKALCIIAMECAFTDQSHFQNVFRRVTGRTPGFYRAECRGNGK